MSFRVEVEPDEGEVTKMWIDYKPEGSVEYTNLIEMDNTRSVTFPLPSLKGYEKVEFRIRVKDDSGNNISFEFEMPVDQEIIHLQTDCDVDNDGFENSWWCGGGDCDDGNASIHPGADEICNDGIDNNCDGVFECECTIKNLEWEPKVEKVSHGDNVEMSFDALVCQGRQIWVNLYEKFTQNLIDTFGPFSPSGIKESIRNPWTANGEHACKSSMECKIPEYYFEVDIGDGVFKSRGLFVNYPACDQDEDGFYNSGCGGIDCGDDNPYQNPSLYDPCDSIDNDCDDDVDEDCPCGITYARWTKKTVLSEEMVNLSVGIIPDIMCVLPHTTVVDIYREADGAKVKRLYVKSLTGVEDYNVTWDNINESGTVDCLSGVCRYYYMIRLITEYGTVSEPFYDGSGDILEVRNYCDMDGDGYRSVDCDGDDCNDEDESIHPGAKETCGDGIDSDCDGNDCVCTITNAYWEKENLVYGESVNMISEAPACGGFYGYYEVYREDDVKVFETRSILPFPLANTCLLYTSPSPRDLSTSRMPSSA